MPPYHPPFSFSILPKPHLSLSSFSPNKICRGPIKPPHISPTPLADLTFAECKTPKSPELHHLAATINPTDSPSPSPSQERDHRLSVHWRLHGVPPCHLYCNFPLATVDRYMFSLPLLPPRAATPQYPLYPSAVLLPSSKSPVCCTPRQ